MNISDMFLRWAT